MFEIELSRAAEDVLEECHRRGLVVKVMRGVSTWPGIRHWHVARPRGPGTLELTEWRGRTWLRVAVCRGGGGADALALELAEQSS